MMNKKLALLFATSILVGCGSLGGETDQSSKESSSVSMSSLQISSEETTSSEESSQQIVIESSELQSSEESSDDRSSSTLDERDLYISDIEEAAQILQNTVSDDTIYFEEGYIESENNGYIFPVSSGKYTVLLDRLIQLPSGESINRNPNSFPSNEDKKDEIDPETNPLYPNNLEEAYTILIEAVTDDVIDFDYGLVSKTYIFPGEKGDYEVYSDGYIYLPDGKILSRDITAFPRYQAGN